MPIYLLFLGSGQLNLWTPMSLPLVIQSRSNSSAWLAWKILKQIKFLCLYWLKQPFKAEPYAICTLMISKLVSLNTIGENWGSANFELLWLSHISYVAITLYLTESPCSPLSHSLSLWVSLYLTESPYRPLSHPVTHWVTLYPYKLLSFSFFGSPCI